MKLSDTAGNTELFSLLLDPQNKQGTSELIKNNPAPAETKRASGGKDIKEPAPATTETDNEKVLINFKVSKRLKRDFDALCKDKEITLTAGIKLAMKQIIENGGF